MIHVSNNILRYIQSTIYKVKSILGAIVGTNIKTKFIKSKNPKRVIMIDMYIYLFNIIIRVFIPSSTKIFHIY